jgi:hypothetical protein
MKYNSLEFIQLTEPKIRVNGIKRKRALFKCDCGSIKDYDFSAVKTGHTKNCKECGNNLRAKSKTKHGMSKDILYKKWSDMKKRCYNKNVDRYNQYGALGIKVCNEWKNSFESFYNWSLENGYKKGLSLERQNVNGNYEPLNCIYISLRNQHFNKKNTRYVLYKNKKIALSELLYNNNLSNKLSCAHSMLNRGKTIEDILFYYKQKIKELK